MSDKILYGFRSSVTVQFGRHDVVIKFKGANQMTEIPHYPDEEGKPYCRGCQEYKPIARYQREMIDPNMRKCIHASLCARVAREVEKNLSVQITLF